MVHSPEPFNMLFKSSLLGEIPFTFYIIHFTLYILHFTFYILHFTFYILHYTLFIHKIPSAKSSTRKRKFY